MLQKRKHVSDAKDVVHEGEEDEGMASIIEDEEDEAAEAGGTAEAAMLQKRKHVSHANDVVHTSEDEATKGWSTVESVKEEEDEEDEATSEDEEDEEDEVRDTPGWSNHHGATCSDYASHGWCKDGKFLWPVTGQEGKTHARCHGDCAERFNHPGHHCVVCGKKLDAISAAGEDTGKSDSIDPSDLNA